MKRALIAVTPGDPEGIGPEVTWKALKSLRPGQTIFCVGAKAPFAKLKAPVTELETSDFHDRASLVKKLRSAKSPRVFLFPAPETSDHHLPGFQSGWSIET